MGSAALGERLATVRKDILPFYRVLGLNPGAGPNEIRRAYRQLMQQWHPDLFKAGSPMQTTAEDMTKEINEAYAELYRKKRYRQYPPPAEAKAKAAAESAVAPKPSPHPRAARPKAPPPAPRPKSAGSRWSRWRAGWNRWQRRRAVRWGAAGAVAAAALAALWNFWPEHRFRRPPATESPRSVSGPVAAASPTPTSQPAAAPAEPTATPPPALMAAGNAGPTTEPVERAPAAGPARIPAVRRWAPASNLLSLAPGPEDGRKWQAAEAAGETDKLAGVDKLIVDLFEPGDSKARVIAVQGPPDAEGGSVLRYGSSLVYFRDGRVRGWVDREPRLRVRWWEATVMPTLDRFSTGSSRAEVVQAQGQPSAYTLDQYLYGSSAVNFAGGRVTGWVNGDTPLRAFDLPALPGPPSLSTR